MKKLGIYILMFMCLLMTGCGNEVKEVATLDEFATVANNNNLTVFFQDYSDVDYIVEARKATSNNGIEIEMLAYTSSEYSKKVQDEQIESFNLLKTTGAHEVKDKGKNYYKYALVSNGYYMVNVRVDNTLVFCKTLLANKDAVEKIFDELGY